jgi:tetratricopeptide (TPR) repeat protein
LFVIISIMELLVDRAVIARILILAALISGLGLSALPHRFQAELALAGQALHAAQASSGSKAAYTEAARRLETAAGFAPQRSDLWEAAGTAAIQSGDPVNAIRLLERAGGLSANDPPVGKGLSVVGLVVLGDAYLQMNQPAAAVIAYDRAAAAGLETPAIYEKLLLARRAAGDAPGAAIAARRLSELQPGNSVRLTELGLMTAALQPEKGVEILTRAAARDPAAQPALQAVRRAVLSARSADDPVYTLISTGRALAGLDRWELAVDAFREAARQRPDYAEAWAYLGEALQHLPPPGAGTRPSQQAAAPITSTPDPNQGPGLAELQRARQLDPNSLAANSFLALYWQRRARPDLARQIFEEAVRLAPASPALQAALGEALAVNGDLSAAEAAYRKAAALAPNDPLYLRLLAGFALDYNYQPGEIAVQAARQAILLTSDAPENQDLMARVLLSQNDRAGARRFIDRALELDPGYAPAHLRLGALLLLEGEAEAARAELQRVIDLAPGSPEAAQAARLLQPKSP